MIYSGEKKGLEEGRRGKIRKGKQKRNGKKKKYFKSEKKQARKMTQGAR